MTLKCTQGVCADRASAIDAFARPKPSPGIDLEMVYCNGIDANALADQMHRHSTLWIYTMQVLTLQHFPIWPGARAHSRPIRNRVSILVQSLFSSGVSSICALGSMYTPCIHRAFNQCACKGLQSEQGTHAIMVKMICVRQSRKQRGVAIFHQMAHRVFMHA